MNIFRPHPFLFFNADGTTFTFMGFFVDRRTGRLINPQTGQQLDASSMITMKAELYDLLTSNFYRVNMSENFDDLTRYKQNNENLSEHL